MTPMETTAPSRLRKEGNRVWIEGGRRYGFGQGRDNSVISALQTALELMGREETYPYLMGVSGAAFRLQFHESGWCPSSPHAFCGYQVMKDLEWALGLQLMETHSQSEDDGDRRRIGRVIAESIDKGMPALYGSEEEGLIVGYEDQGKVLLTLHPFNSGQGMEPMAKWPWGFHLIRVSGAAPDKKEVLSKSLQRAVDLGRGGAVPGMGGGPGYVYGLQVYERWIKDLEDEERNDKFREQEKQQAQLGNAWNYECLVDRCQAAENYLTMIAPEAPAESRSALGEAAALYQRMGREVLTDAGHGHLSLAPFPWDQTWGKNWTGEMRKEQAQRLRAAAQLEAQALVKLGEAMGAWL